MTSVDPNSLTDTQYTHSNNDDDLPYRTYCDKHWTIRTYTCNVYTTQTCTLVFIL